MMRLCIVLVFASTAQKGGFILVDISKNDGFSKTFVHNYLLLSQFWIFVQMLAELWLKKIKNKRRHKRISADVNISKYNFKI